MNIACGTVLECALRTCSRGSSAVQLVPDGLTAAAVFRSLRQDAGSSADLQLAGQTGRNLSGFRAGRLRGSGCSTGRHSTRLPDEHTPRGTDRSGSLETRRYQASMLRAASHKRRAFRRSRRGRQRRFAWSSQLAGIDSIVPATRRSAGRIERSGRGEHSAGETLTRSTG